MEMQLNKLKNMLIIKQTLKEALFDFNLKDLEPVISKYKEFYLSFIDRNGFVNVDFLKKVINAHNDNFTRIASGKKTEKFIYFESSTQKLNSKSKYISAVNKINPVPIYIGYSFLYTTSYIANEQIFFTISQGEIVSLINCYNEDRSVFLFKETEIFVKNLKECEHNVSHEISHWIDLSFNNFVKPHFNDIKKIAKINNVSFDLLITSPGAITMASYFEINAQVHTIKTLKDKYSKEWDSYTIYDIISKSASLEIVFQTLSKLSLKYSNNWIKHLLKRMYREKLLGKKMMENKSIGFSEYNKKYINENLDIDIYEINRDLEFMELLKP